MEYCISLSAEFRECPRMMLITARSPLWNLVNADSFPTIGLVNGLHHKLTALLQILPGVVQAAPVPSGRLQDELPVGEDHIRCVFEGDVALPRRRA